MKFHSADGNLDAEFVEKLFATMLQTMEVLPPDKEVAGFMLVVEYEDGTFGRMGCAKKPKDV